MLSVKQILNELKRKNVYQEVLAPDKDGNARFIYLRYNPLRHKYYLEDEIHSVQRRSIGKRQAEIIVAKTLNFLLKSSRVK